jgi:hypothetical protein
VSRVVVCALVLLALVVAGCGSGEHANRTAQELQDVSKIGDLAARFDASAGRPRLVLLFSPT